MTKAEAVFLAGYTHGDLMAYAIDHDCSVNKAIEQIYDKLNPVLLKKKNSLKKN